MHILYTRITIETLRHLYVIDQRTLITKNNNNEKDEKDRLYLRSQLYVMLFYFNN